MRSGCAPVVWSIAAVVSASVAFPQPGAAQPAAQNRYPAEIDTVLHRYEKAWERLDPFGLFALGSADLNPFRDVVADPRFDDVREARVELTDVVVASAGVPGLWSIEATKIHEELFYVGTATRGVTRLQLRIIEERGRYLIAEHRVIGRPSNPGGEPYASSNPKTWHGELGAQAEAFYRGYGALLDAECSTAVGALGPLVAEGGWPGLEGYLFDAAIYKAQVFYFLSECAERSGETDRARTLIEAAVRLHPNFPLALNELAERAMADRDYRAALGYWRQSLEAHADQPEIHSQLEFVASGLDHYSDPEQREAYLGIRGQPSSLAESALRSLLRRDKRNPETRRRLAIIYLQSNDFTSAEKVLLENEYLYPTDLETQYILARTYLAMDRVDDALEVFVRVWSAEPGYRDTLVYLAELNGYFQRYRAAMRFLEEARRRDEEDPSTLYKLGLYSIRLGRQFEGEMYLRRAQRNRPAAAIRADIARQLGLSIGSPRRN